MWSFLILALVGALLALTLQLFWCFDEPYYFRPSAAGARSVVVADGVGHYLSAHDCIDECSDSLFVGNHDAAYQIVVSKQSHTLSLYDSLGGLICRYPCSVGRNFGDKQVPGDLKTPEGEFVIEKIQDASWWGHDSGDGNGFIPSCYGNWFLRLYTPPHTGIGIHASIRRHSVGRRASEGCMCLYSENLDKLRPYVKAGMKVIIETSIKDMEADGRCMIITENVADRFLAYDPLYRQRVPSGIVVQEPKSHVVKQGDTYLSLAVMYSTTRRNLAMLNVGVNPDSLKVGDTILVTGEFAVHLDDITPSIYDPLPVDTSTDTLYYEATAIDNFGRIAVMHRTKRDKIIELNPGINPDSLIPGMRIRVR